MNGKLHDVLIVDKMDKDMNTGVESLSSWITVWADVGNLEIIRQVEGVVAAYNHNKNTEYSVNLDPRYSREYVKQEIEAAILCGKE